VGESEHYQDFSPGGREGDFSPGDDCVVSETDHGVVSLRGWRGLIHKVIRKKVLHKFNSLLCSDNSPVNAVFLQRTASLRLQHVVHE
jgi:hypothetical protein